MTFLVDLKKNQEFMKTRLNNGNAKTKRQSSKNCRKGSEGKRNKSPKARSIRKRKTKRTLFAALKDIIYENHRFGFTVILDRFGIR